MARNLSLNSIPEGWEYNLLDKFADRRSGHTPSRSFENYWNGGIKWISLADSYRLDKGYIHETDNEISEEGIKNSSAELHPAGTVVLSRDAGIGKSAVMAVPMAVSQHFIAWRCDNNQKLNSWFLYNWLQLNKTEFERQAVGSTIKTIGLPYFKKLKIAVPPYVEQKKISQILYTWDKAISTTEKLLKNSQKQKQALMQQILTGKKRLLDDNEVLFRGDWELFEVGKLIKESRIPSVNNDPSKRLTVRLNFKGIEHRDFRGTESPDSTAHFVRSSGQFIYGKQNIHKGAFGIIPEEFDGFETSQDLPAFDFTGKCTSSWLMYYFSQELFFKNLENKMSGTGSKRLNPNLLYKVKIPVPTIKEQQKIGKVLSAADQTIRVLQQKLDHLKKEKKALMQQLLTGKCRVKIDS